MEAVTEKEESSAIEQAKTRWTQLEAIIGNKERLIIVAKDIVEHFEKRLEIFEGKGLIVAMSRRIAVELIITSPFLRLSNFALLGTIDKLQTILRDF